MKAFNYQDINIEDVIREIEGMSEAEYNAYRTAVSGVLIDKHKCSSGRFEVVVDGEQKFLSESEDEVDAFIVGMRQGYLSCRERHVS